MVFRAAVGPTDLNSTLGHELVVRRGSFTDGPAASWAGGRPPGRPAIRFRGGADEGLLFREAAAAQDRCSFGRAFRDCPRRFIPQPKFRSKLRAAGRAVLQVEPVRDSWTRTSSPFPNPEALGPGAGGRLKLKKGKYLASFAGALRTVGVRLSVGGVGAGALGWVMGPRTERRPPT